MEQDKRLALKEVLAELSVSRTTFWRARASQIDGFPEPQAIGGLLYWRRSQLASIEAALLRYGGRCKFEQARRHRAIIAARRSRVRPLATQTAFDNDAQLRLFDFEE